MRETLKTAQFTSVNALIHVFFVPAYLYIFFILLFSYFCSLMSHLLISESVKVSDSHLDFVLFNLKRRHKLHASPSYMVI